MRSMILSTVLFTILPTTVDAASGPPCDLFAASGTPCVAAHSLTRALFSDYAGPLYRVRRSSDNSTLDISVLSRATGVADSAK